MGSRNPITEHLCLLGKSLRHHQNYCHGRMRSGLIPELVNHHETYEDPLTPLIQAL